MIKIKIDSDGVLSATGLIPGQIIQLELLDWIYTIERRGSEIISKRKERE